MTKRRKPGRLRLNVYRGRPGASLNIPVGELVLEYFDDNQLLAWRASGTAIQDYHYLWYFELERQRASNQVQLLEALSFVPGITVPLSSWGRALAYKYSGAPLSCIGSLKWVGGRFNYGADIDSSRFAPFPALYLAEDAETALREMHGLQRGTTRGGLTAFELSLLSQSGVAWVTVDGHAHNIFDLTSAANLHRFAAVISKFTISRAVRAAEDRMGAVPLRLMQTPDDLFDSFMIEGWREFPVQVMPSGATCCELSAKTFAQLEALA